MSVCACVWRGGQWSSHSLSPCVHTPTPTSNHPHTHLCVLGLVFSEAPLHGPQRLPQAVSLHTQTRRLLTSSLCNRPRPRQVRLYVTHRPRTSRQTAADVAVASCRWRGVNGRLQVRSLAAAVQLLPLVGVQSAASHSILQVPCSGRTTATYCPATPHQHTEYRHAGRML